MKLESIEEATSLRHERDLTLKLRNAARSGTIGKFPIIFSGEEVDVFWIVSADPIRAAIIVECEDRLADIDVKLARLGVRVDDPFQKADRDVNAWRRSAEMYSRAWLRELGGTVYQKAHFIDALVLTTERMRLDAEKLPAVRAALATAIGHVKHMAAWITKQNAPDPIDKPFTTYSFESLGEDMPGMEAQLGKTK